MPLDLLFNCWLGLGFALCARERIRADGPFAFPAFHLLATFAGIVLVPITMYLYLAHPAWSWMYLTDPAGVPGLALLPLVVAHAGLPLAGWYVAARLLRSGRERILVYVVAGTPVVLLVATLLCWGRLGKYGSYAAFHEGRALSLMQVKLGYVMIGVMVGLAAAAGYLALELLRDSRRVRSR
jgi:hypothetical protein